MFCIAKYNRPNGIGKPALLEDTFPTSKHGNCHIEGSDFSFRSLLEGGRHQTIVWARSGSESVLMTESPKKIRENGISTDIAARACRSAAVPDKHKEAMEPSAQDSMMYIKAKAPAKSFEAADELAKAKAKLAKNGITMSPVKRKRDHDYDSEPSQSADKRAKPALAHTEPESTSRAQQLFNRFSAQVG